MVKLTLEEKLELAEKRLEKQSIELQRQRERILELKMLNKKLSKVISKKSQESKDLKGNKID